jgi:hypothetical protein
VGRKVEIYYDTDDPRRTYVPTAGFLKEIVEKKL